MREVRETGRESGVSTRASTEWIVPWLVVCAFTGVATAVSLWSTARFSVESYTPLFRTADGRVPATVVLDHVEHLRMVEYFRGELGPPRVAPFSGRLLLPWLAAQLPLDAGAALALVNVALLWAGTAALLSLATWWRASCRTLWWCAWVVCAAFPLVMLKSPFFVDAGTAGLVMVVVWAGFRRVWLGPLLLAVAVLAKESALVSLPFGVALAWCRPAGTGTRAVPRALETAAWCAAGLAGVTAASVLAPEAYVRFAPWAPEPATVLTMVRVNLRPGSGLLAAALSALPSAVISICYLWWWRRDGGDDPEAREGHGWTDPVERSRALPLLVGVAASALLGFASFAIASLDARTVWTGVAFAVPLLVLLVAHSTPLGSTGPAADAPDVRTSNRPLLVTLVVVSSVGLMVTSGGAVGALVSSRTGPEVRVQGGVVDGAGPPVHGTGPDTLTVAPVGDRADGATWLVLDFAVDGDGPFELSATSASGPSTTLASGDGPYRGLLVAPPGTTRLRVVTDGAWEVGTLGLDDALQWDGFSEVRGTGDLVIRLPGEPRYGVEVAGEDPDMTVSVVTGDGLVTLPGSGRVLGPKLPAQSWALVIDSDGPWVLTGTSL